MSNHEVTETASLGADDAPARSFEELLASAEGGDVEAQSLLGICYMNGDDGVEQDRIEAQRWLRLAARQGDSLAQINLGVYYLYEEVAEQDLVEADMCLRAAGVFDFTGGMHDLDTMTPEIRLSIFKHLEAADLCRLGCTSWSVNSWLRIQPATWVQWLSTTSDSASPTSTLDRRPFQYRTGLPIQVFQYANPLPIKKKQEAYCFSLNRLGSLGLAAAPYAEAIAAYADPRKYGEEVGSFALYIIAGYRHCTPCTGMGCG